MTMSGLARLSEPLLLFVAHWAEVAKPPAGITRGELFETVGHRKQITFHDLRATGITFLAMRGDSDQLVRDKAGHADFSTTLGYWT